MPRLGRVQYLVLVAEPLIPNLVLSTMQTLTAELGDRSYLIHTGAGLLDQPELILQHLLQKP